MFNICLQLKVFNFCLFICNGLLKKTMSNVFYNELSVEKTQILVFSHTFNNGIKL